MKQFYKKEHSGNIEQLSEIKNMIPEIKNSIEKNKVKTSKSFRKKKKRQKIAKEINGKN